MHLRASLTSISLMLGLTAMCGPTPETQHQTSPAVASQEKPAAKQKRKKWQPATWRGLTVGTSTRDDVLKLLGKPIREDFADDNEADQVWFIYNDVGDFPGQLEAHLDKQSGRLVAMSLGMTQDIQKETILDLLGKDYELVRYDACPDDPEAEAGPFYESPNGAALYFEYRSLGIAIHVDSKGYVYGIEYLQKPPGLSSRDECPPYVAPKESPH
jgi:hypothetical protein